MEKKNQIITSLIFSCTTIISHIEKYGKILFIKAKIKLENNLKKYEYHLSTNKIFSF